MTTFALACTSCLVGLVIEGASLRCASCGATFRRLAGIWRFLPESRARAFAEFLHDYQIVRKAEGWGVANAEYIRSLPHVSTKGPLDDTWRTRSRSFQTLLGRVIRPIEAEHTQPLKILDVGAGNGWLSYQLARRGHKVAAIDISMDDADGLGAFVWYDYGTRTGDDDTEAFIPIQAEFDRLPFLADQADLVVFNAALHYSTNYHVTLSEALRVLRADGHLIVLDSPVYRNPASGDIMVREREAAFQRKYGFSATAIQSEGFLTHSRLGDLASTLDLQLRVIDPIPGWRSTLRAVKTWLRGQREPAGFPVLVMRRTLLAAR